MMRGMTTIIKLYNLSQLEMNIQTDISKKKKKTWQYNGFFYSAMDSN